MEFFCDTGILIAYSLPDSFSKSCSMHFQKYPHASNKYFFCLEVKKEFEHKKIDRIKRIGLRSRIERTIELQSKEFFTFAIEKNYHNDSKFDTVKKSIHDELSDKTGKPYEILENDARILGNSILWAVKDNPIMPYFFTTDYNDIVKNKEFILIAASNALGIKVILEFMGLASS